MMTFLVAAMRLLLLDRPFRGRLVSGERHEPAVAPGLPRREPPAREDGPPRRLEPARAKLIAADEARADDRHLPSHHPPPPRECLQTLALPPRRRAGAGR